jgi:hypothetical protein
VAVVTVGGDDVVVFAEERDAPDSDRFLADVKVEEAPDVTIVIVLQ